MCALEPFDARLCCACRERSGGEHKQFGELAGPGHLFTRPPERALLILWLGARRRNVRETRRVVVRGRDTVCSLLSVVEDCRVLDEAKMWEWKEERVQDALLLQLTTPASPSPAAPESGNSQSLGAKEGANMGSRSGVGSAYGNGRKSVGYLYTLHIVR